MYPENARIVLGIHCDTRVDGALLMRRKQRDIRHQVGDDISVLFVQPYSFLDGVLKRRIRRHHVRASKRGYQILELLCT